MKILAPVALAILFAVPAQAAPPEVAGDQCIEFSPLTIAKEKKAYCKNGTLKHVGGSTYYCYKSTSCPSGYKFSSNRGTCTKSGGTVYANAKCAFGKYWVKCGGTYKCAKKNCTAGREYGCPSGYSCNGSCSSHSSKATACRKTVGSTSKSSTCPFGYKKSYKSDAKQYRCIGSGPYWK